jgi:hypothetical protein
MSASGKYGPTRCIAGMVGYAVSDGCVRGIRNGARPRVTIRSSKDSAGVRPKECCCDAVENFRLSTF